MSASTRKIAKGAAVNILGEILSSAGEPLLYMVISRMIGPRVLGVYVLVEYCTALILRLVVMGLDRGLLRHVPIACQAVDHDERLAKVLGTAIRQVAVIGAIVVLLVNPFPQLVLRISGDTPTLQAPEWLAIMVIAVPAQALTRIILFAIRGLSNMWAFVVVQNVVAPAMLLSVSLVPIALSMDPIFIASAYTISAYVTLSVAILFFKREFKGVSLRKLLLADIDGALVRFSWPQGVTEMLNFLLSRIDILMIAAFFPERPDLVE
jgi:O-antigen/teichoic acid export membrane protein